MEKHTPGPWRVEPDYQSRRIGDMYSSGGYEEILVGFNIVAENGTEIVGCEGIIDAEDTNARLIAAAPELLETLKILYAHLFGPATALPRHEIDDLCVSIIAKAEGRS